MDKKEKKSLPEPRTYTVEQIAAMLNIGRTIRKRGISKSATMRRYFPAISTMTIKTVRGSRPKMYQNQRKIFCFFLRGLRSEQGVDVFPCGRKRRHTDG